MVNTAFDKGYAVKSEDASCIFVLYHARSYDIEVERSSSKFTFQRLKFHRYCQVKMYERISEAVVWLLSKLQLIPDLLSY